MRAVRKFCYLTPGMWQPAVYRAPHQALKREHRAVLCSSQSFGLLLKTWLTVWKRKGYPSKELYPVTMTLNVNMYELQADT